MAVPQFYQRDSGIPSVGDLPWGSHVCQLYETTQDLLDVLVPYIKAGLENDERCCWVTSGPLTVKGAERALAAAVPALAEHRRRGQLEILPASRWPASGEQVGETIVRYLDGAILRGFSGLRLACPADPKAARGRDGASLGVEAIGTLNVIALVSYPRDQVDAVGLMDVINEHRCALVRNADRWDVLAGSQAHTARAALARSEEKLRTLFRNMSEGFAYHRIVLDPDGKPCDYVFLEVNEAFARLTGLGPEQLVGRRVSQVLPGIERDPSDWIGRYGQVALSGQPLQFESYATALDRWYAVSAFSPHKGFFACTFSDITARKRAEAERRAIEERLRVTLRSIGDAVLSTDAAGRITFLNRVAEALTGWPEAEALGRPAAEVFRIIDEETRAPGEDIIRRVLSEKRVVELANHTALVARDGREIPIEDSAAPILTSGGELAGAVLVFHDVTAKRRAEQTLRQARDELELRVAERTRELGDANEELRARAAQLRALAGELTLAEQRERRRIASLLHDGLQQLLVAAKLRVGALQRSTDERARTAGGQASALLDEAIRSSRSLTAEISPPILYAGGLLAGLRWLVGWMQEKHALAVVLGGDDPAHLPEDVNVLLFESVREILFNVVKHAAASQARVDVRSADGHLRITVSDDGVGFDPTLPRPAGRAGGYGLLSIRERLSLLGGTLTIDSAPGQGTRLALSVPAAAVAPAARGRSRSHGSAVRTSS